MKLTNIEKALLLSAISQALVRRETKLSELRKYSSLYGESTVEFYERDFDTLKSLIEKLELEVE